MWWNWRNPDDGWQLNCPYCGKHLEINDAVCPGCKQGLTAADRPADPLTALVVVGAIAIIALIAHFVFGVDVVAWFKA